MYEIYLTTWMSIKIFIVLRLCVNLVQWYGIILLSVVTAVAPATALATTDATAMATLSCRADADPPLVVTCTEASAAAVTIALASSSTSTYASAWVLLPTARLTPLETATATTLAIDSELALPKSIQDRSLRNSWEMQPDYQSKILEQSCI